MSPVPVTIPDSDVPQAAGNAAQTAVAADGNSSGPVAGQTAHADRSSAGSAAATTELPSSTLDFAAKMFSLARAGESDLLAYIDAGLPSNLTNNRGDTLLMLASYHGHASLVEQLLQRGADANQLNGKGQSCVAGAVFKGHDDVIKVLLRGGADPLAGTPTADDTAKMFHKWEGQEGYQALFEGASGRGKGAREAAPPVEDREEAQRIPGDSAVA